MGRLEGKAFMPVGVPEVPVWAAFVLNETLFPSKVMALFVHCLLELMTWGG